ncbi:MAG: DUF4258 domain-containing protein [Thermoanaerobaculia bacterium]|nr:DUF4258 domain-containing protein [Thermoanaerobaculia bacterium]
MTEGIVEKIRGAARRRLLFLPHAVRQMSRPDRMIDPSAVEAAVLRGTLIEDYPEDVRGHSCLFLGFEQGSGAPIHVVCSPKDDYLAIITAYRPDPSQWAEGFRRRR